jgi:ribosome biogenesis GTPase
MSGGRPGLKALGWNEELERSFEPDAAQGLEPARVFAAHGSLVAVEAEDGEQLVPLRGALRHRAAEEGAAALPVVGDWVSLDPDGAIVRVLPRRGVLARASEEGATEVLAAHVDVALIATSLNLDLNERRLERFLSLATGGDVRPVVLLTKGDLDPDPFAVAARVERAVGAEALPISVRDGWGVGDVLALIEPGRTAALLGMSGVGKSTLVNELLGEERQHTLPIRERDDRGRHATSQRELFVLPGGGLLIDTPGLRLPRVSTGEGVEDAFADVLELAAECRFADCSHTSEPGCAVLAAIESGELAPERLEAMRTLEREARWAEERQGGPGAAARRERSRAGTRAYRDAVKGKRWSPDR